MADSKTPKHDFAPAWLKLSSQENKTSKPLSNHYPSDPKLSPQTSHNKSSSEASDTKRSVRSRRDSGNYRAHDRYDALQRQHSFDNYPDNGRYGSKLRHHSVEDYYSYQYNSYTAYNGGYPDSQYTSQPSLQRQSKYHQPNTRYNKMMGVYPPYYDMYPYDFYSGEPYYGYPARSKRTSYPDREPRTPTRDKKHTDRDHHHPEPDFNEEFPSLNRDDGDKNITNTKLSNGAGVWDKPLKKNLAPSENTCSIDGVKESPSKVSSSYKVLVPNKNVLPKKGSLRINGTHTNQDPSLISGALKVNGEASTTPPMEILNSRLHTHTRSRGDKSEFLKTLRNTATCNGPDGAPANQQSQECDNLSDDVVYGVESLKVDSSENMLSSSVEAEQRLLREMGWTEFDDGEEYVITEDEMREFQSLSQQVKQQPINGLVRALPKTWSPGHVTITQAQFPSDLKDDLFSSSDSDDSC